MNKRYLILLSFLVSFCTNAQSDSLFIANLFHKSANKIKEDHFQMDIVYEYSDGYSESNGFRQEGVALKKGGETYTKLGNLEVLGDEKGVLTISNEERMMQYEKNTNRLHQFQKIDINTVMPLFKCYTYEITADSYICSFSDPLTPLIGVVALEVIMDKDFQVRKQTLVSKMNLSTGGFLGNVRVEKSISFSFSAPKPIDNNTSILQISDVITIDKKKVTTKKLYKDYQLNVF